MRLAQFDAWLVNRSRPYIFSTGVSPPVAAAARRAVEIVRQEPQRRHQVLALAEPLRRELAQKAASWATRVAILCR